MAGLGRRLAEIERRVRPTVVAPAATPAVLNETWRDKRLWDTVLGVIAGALAPGEYAPGVPEELWPKSAEYVNDEVEVSALLRDHDSIVEQRARAWLAVATKS